MERSVIPRKSRRGPVNLSADLDRFLVRHRGHGRMWSTVGELTLKGRRLRIKCRCGVTFQRWTRAKDMVNVLLRKRGESGTAKP